MAESIRLKILRALVDRLSVLPGWTVQLRNTNNDAPASDVQAIVCFLTEDKSLANDQLYDATMQVLVFIQTGAERPDPNQPGETNEQNAYAMLDGLVADAERRIHAPDSWGLDPDFTDVRIVGHDVDDPTDSNEMRASLRLTFTYRHLTTDPAA